jgi:kynurenine formamidase
MCTEVPSSTGMCAHEPESRGAAPRRTLSRRGALLGSVGAATGAALTLTGLPAEAAPAKHPTPSRPRRGRSADLTYVLGEDFPAFTPGEEARRRTGTTIPANGYYLQEWTLIEHIGTHVDAPAHFAAGGRYASELTLADLVLPASVVDITAKAVRDPDATVEVADLRVYERRHGRIPPEGMVIMNSGWQRHVGDPDAYRGTDAQGVLHFPGFSADAVEWLIRRRRTRAFGVDTLSLDPGESATFAAHHLSAEADRYNVENVANVAQLPPRGARVVVGLIPYEQGSGGQARVLAEW